MKMEYWASENGAAPSWTIRGVSLSVAVEIHFSPSLTSVRLAFGFEGWVEDLKLSSWYILTPHLLRYTPSILTSSNQPVALPSLALLHSHVSFILHSPSVLFTSPSPTALLWLVLLANQPHQYSSRRVKASRLWQRSTYCCSEAFGKHLPAEALVSKARMESDQFHFHLNCYHLFTESVLILIECKTKIQV